MSKVLGSAESQLRWFFRRNGYFRVPNETRRKKEKQGYKKGYEIRFTAFDRKELATVRALLHTAGFRAGKPFKKHTLFIQPVYGKDAYQRFRNLI